MNLDLSTFPVFQWKHREFTSVDPWADGRAATWELHVYKMTQGSWMTVMPATGQLVPSKSNYVPRQLAIGIFNPGNHRYRILPRALQDLWRSGKIPDEDLPGMLYKIEDPLYLSDYPPGRMPLLMKRYAIFFGLLVLLGMAVRSYHPYQSDLGWVGFWTAASLLPLATLCLLTYLSLQVRGKLLARRWLAMAEGYSAERLWRIAVTALAIPTAALLISTMAFGQAHSVPTITLLSRVYHVGSFNKHSAPMWEFVPPGETVQNWSSLVTLVERNDAHTRPELDAVAEGVMATYKSNGGQVLLARTMTDASGTPFNYLVAGFEQPAEHRFELNFVKIGLGPKNVYMMIYGARVTDPVDWRSKAKTYLNQHSSEIGKALETATVPDLSALPRNEF